MFDDDVRAATEQMLTSLRGHVEADLLGYTEEIARVAAAERAWAADLGPAVLRGQLLRLEELVQGIRALEAARSLADVLNQLLQAVSADVDRVALLTVEGDVLREWRSIGFPQPLTNSGILTLDEAGLAGTAVRSGQATGRPPGPSSDSRQPSQAPFAAADSRHAVAVPISVAGRVVAVLYADAPTAGSAPDSGWWSATLEVLARYAGRVLEVITIRQVIGPESMRPVAHASQTPPSTEPSPRSLQ